MNVETARHTLHTATRLNDQESEAVCVVLAELDRLRAIETAAIKVDSTRPEPVRAALDELRAALGR